MYDIKWIRENAEIFDRGRKRRGLEPLAETLLALDETPRGDREVAGRARAAQRGIEGNRRRDEGGRCCPCQGIKKQADGKLKTRC